MSVTKLLISICLCTILLGPIQKSHAQSGRASADNQETIRRLIGQLGSPRYRERARATETLEYMSGLALDELEKAESNDPEINARVQRIRDEIKIDSKLRATLRILQDLKTNPNNIQIDRLVDASVNWHGDPEDEALWLPILNLIGDIENRVDTDKFSFKGRACSLPPKRNRSPVTHKFCCGIDYYHQNQAYTTQFLTAKNTDCLLLMSTSVALVSETVTNSVMEAGTGFFNSSNVRLQPRTIGSIVVCDGSIETDDAVRCILIARGEIVIKRDTVASLLIAGSKVTCNPKANFSESKVIENEIHPLGMIEWFQPSSLGMEVSPVRGGMKIDALIDKKIASQSGLKVGDIIISIDRKPFKDAASFRKQLRAGSVLERCWLTVLRDGKSLDFVLDFQGEFENKKANSAPLVRPEAVPRP